MYKYMRQVISLTAFLCLSACVTVAPPPRGALAAKVELQGMIPFLDFVDMRSTRRNGLLVVQSTVVNVTSENHHVVYRYKWLDRAGFTVGGDEPWKPLPLYAKQSQSINGVAPSPQVEDFRLVVQYPDD